MLQKEKSRAQEKSRGEFWKILYPQDKENIVNIDIVQSYLKYLLTTPTSLLDAVQIALPRKSQRISSGHWCIVAISTYMKISTDLQTTK